MVDPDPSSDASSDPPSDLAVLGRTVRAQRKRQGLSVDALSRRSEVGFGVISQLERGIGNPSFGTLNRLSRALGVPLVRLLQESTQHDDMVVRATERQPLPTSGDTEADGVHRELLTPGMHTALQVIRSVFPPGFSNEGQAFRHLGMECVLVLSGSLVVVHGERRVELGPGDAMTYPCSIAHWWANGHDAETVVLGAVTPLEV